MGSLVGVELVSYRIEIETNDNAFTAKLVEHGTRENEKTIDSLSSGVLA